MSDTSTESAVTVRSPTDNTMMHRLTEKTATSSSFSERVKKTLGNVFVFTMGPVTGSVVETQEEEEDNDEVEDFFSQLSLKSSTNEFEASTTRETGYLINLLWSGQKNHKYETAVKRV